MMFSIKILGIAGVIFLSSCGLNTIVMDNSIQDTIRPEYSREHKLTGAYMYGTVDTSVSPLISGIVFMIKNAPDLYLPINAKYTSFLIDVPYESTGIAKIAIRYTKDGSVLDKWILNSYDYDLSKASVQYVTNETVTVMNRIVTNTRVSITNSEVKISAIPQVYYLGRFVVGYNEKIFENILTVKLTNNIIRDQELFLNTYTSMSNMDMIQMDVKEVK